MAKGGSGLGSLVPYLIVGGIVVVAYIYRDQILGFIGGLGGSIASAGGSMDGGGSSGGATSGAQISQQRRTSPPPAAPTRATGMRRRGEVIKARVEDIKQGVMDMRSSIKTVAWQG